MNGLRVSERIMDKLANIKATLELTFPANELKLATVDMSAFGGCKVCEGSCDVGCEAKCAGDCEGGCSGDCEGGFTCAVHIPGCQIF